MIGAYYCTGFFLIGLLTLRQFAENTLLTAVPEADMHVVMLFYIIVLTAGLFFSIEPIARTAYIMLPFIVSGVLVVLLLLVPRYDILLMSPWQGAGLMKAMAGGLSLSGMAFGLWSVPILGRSFQNIRTMGLSVACGIGLAAGLRGLLVSCFLMTFGSSAGMEKVLPFFELTRLVYASRYLQRIESLFILLWVIAGLICILINFYVSLYLLTRLWRLPSMKPLIIPAMIIIAQAAIRQEGLTDVILFHEQVISRHIGGMIVIPAILAGAALIRRRKKPCPSG